MAAAGLRLPGEFGTAARRAMMARLEDQYDDLGFTAEHTSGVAALDQDGTVVAVYYAPNHEMNTSTDYAVYCLQHGIVPPEVLVPIRSRSANDVHNLDAYLPAAARGREPIR
jgi:hypothetical protein